MWKKLIIFIDEVSILIPIIPHSIHSVGHLFFFLSGGFFFDIFTKKYYLCKTIKNIDMTTKPFFTEAEVDYLNSLALGIKKRKPKNK